MKSFIHFHSGALVIANPSMPYKKVRDQQNEQFAYFSTHPKKKDFIVVTAVLGSH